MQTFQAMLERRSIRKFRSDPIAYDSLEQILDMARLYPSGGNLQPVRFALITTPALCAQLFQDLKWAMYLPEYTIAPGEAPTAYIVLLRDEHIRKRCDYDIGAASTMVMLAAADKGIASCPIGNFHADTLSQMLALPEHLHPELVLALGYPAQQSRVVPMGDTVRYRQDENGDFLVPKWSADELLIYTDNKQP